jgi:lipopolysaccharide/colanic/teichoic acid biosynthesis glycosyltransferase
VNHPVETSAIVPALRVEKLEAARELVTALVHAAASLGALVLMSPVMMLIAIAIKLTSPGPILYRGLRVGRGKRPFTIYKFRTLVVGAEQKIGARLLADEDRASLVTPLGRFLKKSKLDELPQLWNVVRGEMRLVGPRPIRPIFLEEFERDIPGYADRFLVPPGVTGIAQLRGGYYTSPRNKLRYDRLYIQGRSLLLDLQVVLFTVIKILDRWLPTAVILLFLFLFVSFVPKPIRASLDLMILGWNVDLVYFFILLAAALAVMKKELRHFSLQRSPLNRAVLVFVGLGLVLAPFAPDPYRQLQAVGYYLVTGFLVAFLILNTLSTEAITNSIVRSIALTSVAMSLIGLAQLLLLNADVAVAAVDPNQIGEQVMRIASFLGSPMLLAVYLVLGMPLVFSEVARARTQAERDFWLVCSTISVVGIVFTQTRVGLVALLVTGAVFLSRRFRHAFSFVTLFVAGFLLLAFVGVNRYSPARIGEEVTTWIDRQAPILRSTSATDWLVGAGPRQAYWVERKKEKILRPEQARPVPNMHITLAREQGVAMWLVIMWVIVSVVATMKRAHDSIVDERRRIQLWAIISAIVGFLVSMNGINAFHNLPLQILFWSLVGIGLEIVNQTTRARRRNLIWKFGEAGD